MNLFKTMRPELLLLILSACAAACTSDVSSPLLATDVVVTRPMPGAMMSGGYVTLMNNSDMTISITSVTSPQFANVEMHETIIENNIARMRPIDELVIAPGNTVKLKRGGKHLMLMQPDASIDSITLNFYADDLLVLSVSATPDNN